MKCLCTSTSKQRTPSLFDFTVIISGAAMSMFSISAHECSGLSVPKVRVRMRGQSIQRILLGYLGIPFQFTPALTVGRPHPDIVTISCQCFSLSNNTNNIRIITLEIKLNTSCETVLSVFGCVCLFL